MRYRPTTLVIYGASVSKEMVSWITDKVVEEMNHWANRPLQGVYAAVFIFDQVGALAFQHDGRVVLLHPIWPWGRGQPGWGAR